MIPVLAGPGARAWLAASVRWPDRSPVPAWRRRRFRPRRTHGRGRSRLRADASLLIYQPQLESWQGNRATFRAAVGASLPGGGEPAYGVVWATARTEVDPIRRAVTLQDVQISRGDFPTLPDRGGGLPGRAAPGAADHAAHHVAGSDGGVALRPRPRPAPSRWRWSTGPPEIIVSYRPAVLIPIDGEPALRPVPGTSYERVINTLAVILRARAAARSTSTPTTAGSRPMRSTAPGGGSGNRCRSSTASPSRWRSMSRSTC